MPSCAATFTSKAAITALLTPCDEEVHACRGFAASFSSSLSSFFVAEECVACTVVAFPFADFEIFAAAVFALGRGFAELKTDMCGTR